MKPPVRSVLLLFLVSPLVAEYLLGDFTFRQFVLFPLFVPLYGGCAVLVRELARGTGRGWPTIFCLSLACGIAGEALATQSLFNPHYLGLRLLDYGYLPSLGISPPWTVYVLALHTFWSTAVPIGLVEALDTGDSRERWLGRRGLAVVGLVYGLGLVLVALGNRAHEHFMASGLQLGWGAAAAVAAAAAAFLLFGAAAGPATRKGGPAPWVVGLVCFAAGSVLIAGRSFDRFAPPIVPPLFAAVVIAGSLAVLSFLRRYESWGGSHAAAAATGGVLVYGWWGFLVSLGLHGRSSLPGHCFSVVLTLGLLAVLWVRRCRAAAA